MQQQQQQQQQGTVEEDEEIKPRRDEIVMNTVEWPLLLTGPDSPNPSDTSCTGSWDMVSPNSQQQQEQQHHQHLLELANVHSPVATTLPRHLALDSDTDTDIDAEDPPALADEVLLLEIDDVVVVDDDDDSDAVLVHLPASSAKLEHKLMLQASPSTPRQRSISSPDFIHLDRSILSSTPSSSYAMITTTLSSTNSTSTSLSPPPPTTITTSTSTSMTPKIWNGVSFRDIVASQQSVPLSPFDSNTNTTTIPRTLPTLKPRPKFVVTPVRIMRGYESTPNLQALLSSTSNPGATTTTSPSSTTRTRTSTLDEDFILGDTDAMEFYHRKAKGVAGRKNGLKLRPDEAKRKEFTMNKKVLQQQQQQQRQTVASGGR